MTFVEFKKHTLNTRLTTEPSSDSVTLSTETSAPILVSQPQSPDPLSSGDNISRVINNITATIHAHQPEEASEGATGAAIPQGRTRTIGGMSLSAAFVLFCSVNTAVIIGTQVHVAWKLFTVPMGFWVGLIIFSAGMFLARLMDECQAPPPLTALVQGGDSGSKSGPTTEPTQIISELCKEYVSMPVWQQWPRSFAVLAMIAAVASFCHLMFLLPIILYFCSDVQMPLDRLKELASPENAAGSPSISETWRHYKEFLRAAGKVSPLYVIPPFVFVTILSLMNVTSKIILKPSPTLHAVWSYYYAHLSREFCDPRWIRDFTLDVRPWLLTWSLLAPPIALILMLCHTWNKVDRALFPARDEGKVRGLNCLRLRQNPEQPDSSRSNFYNSPWFSLVVALPFLLGIPAAISMWIYWHTGVNHLLGDPTFNPNLYDARFNYDLRALSLDKIAATAHTTPQLLQVVRDTAGQVRIFSPDNITTAAGATPAHMAGAKFFHAAHHTLEQVRYHYFAIPFAGFIYFYSLGWCLAALFFRAYFTFAWNFNSTEYDIEIYDDMIKMLPVKGWFIDFLTSRFLGVPSQICWKDVTSVSFATNKLEADLAGANDHRALAFMKKLCTVYESIARKMDVHSDILQIKSASRTIDVRLWQLSAEQKIQLFQAIRKNAPSIRMDTAVQKALIGSTVLQEPKYTEIWFSVLNSGTEQRQQGDLSRGQKLKDGKYCVKSRLASGGQAVVYQAINEQGDPVILKEFQLTTGEALDIMIESAKEFENETSILEHLCHPNIVRSLDMFFQRGRVYLVLEYVRGKSLRRLIGENGAMSLDQIVCLAKQMCGILRYLHAQEPPIVHRDFTPDNLILQPNGVLKLIDFSVSQYQHDTIGSCAGKHAYTPPEQFRGQACTQSDVYAFGATLYYLATGNDPTPITTLKLPEPVGDDLKALDSIITNSTSLSLASRYESIDWANVDLSALMPSTQKESHVIDLLAKKATVAATCNNIEG